MLKVSYGAEEIEISSGTAKDVATLRKQVENVLNIPASATPEVIITDTDGKETKVEGDLAKAEVPEDAKGVTFVKPSGSKSN